MQTDRNVGVVLSQAGDDKEREPERFVDSETAAEFLSINPRQLLQLARQGTVPAYPLADGKRRVWRFRLSDLAKAMEQRMVHGKHLSTVAVNKARSIR